MGNKRFFLPFVFLLLSLITFAALCLLGFGFLQVAFFIVVLFSGAVYMTGLACYKYIVESLYVNRERIQKAIDEKNYTLAGTPYVNRWIDRK